MKHHHRRKEKRNLSGNVKNLILALCVFLVLAAALVVWMIGENRELSNKEISGKTATETKQSLETVYIDGEAYVPKPGVTSILFFGIDKFGKFTDSNSYNNDEQCDFLSLIVIDRDAGTYQVIHLNRDTMTDVEMIGLRDESAGTKTMQLALAHTYGSGLKDSCRNTVKAVSNLLFGTPVDAYIAVSMDAIPIITDYIGGVPVTIDEDLTALDERYTEGASVLLSGEEALSYVRARQEVSDGTNIARMNRQKLFMNSLVGEIRKKNNTRDFSTTLIRKLTDYMLSDLSVNNISEFSDIVSDYEFAGIISPDGYTQINKGYMEFHADDDSLRKMVTDIFYERIEE